MKCKQTIGRLGCVVTLAGMLIGCALGCQPASSGTGVVPVSTKPNKQPENKDQPGKQPKPDVGRLHPFGPPFARAT
jgi:hypothetical protein